ncbi:uncharacterized protein Z518_03450 [Rhinocladiella mackenziei CBS 650.93]|uniref:Peptidase M24 domain-containing protein n=1 Tax=Rhinocladiella mackenziei CBS 650.93 TaxID=1442369 RepID=A0A0D2HDZ7_9EURO|nr:uncharacterized protein Z518_03450 [Rhinocladiella mackenziei CBS 650.93]KIX08793.1 hypothetical protein Z518_03450 [Rhinocladiella mackenziei CBS 650.93]
MPSSPVADSQVVMGYFAIFLCSPCSKVPYSTNDLNQRAKSKPDVEKVQKCAISNLKSNLSFLDHAVPIKTDEFIQRRDRLAVALVDAKVDAFAVEPGYTFQYYGNISQTDWEPWEPEERPFLMIVQPIVDSATHKVRAKTSFLSPHFEEERVRMLGMPFPANERLDIAVWEEHWNPYETLRIATFNNATGVKIMVDEEMRDYIVRGLDAAGFDTVGLSDEVESVRQKKSPSEVELLRAVNTGTVEAVRQMRPCLVPGLTENEVTTILNNALLSVGFSLFFNIVLFEEDAALPHGGFITGDKVLTYDTMVLIDVGAHYLGYSSDICRSFFIDPPTQSPAHHRSPLSLIHKAWSVFHPASPHSRTSLQPYEPQNSHLHALKLEIWSLVLSAQTASIEAFTPNSSAADVDIAARTVISNAGYGKAFTHRVGHGIGIKAHESPYLNKGNTDTMLRPGMTFTSEPGVYLEGRFGVRHEDIFLVMEDGDEAECLSGQRARGPYEP